MAVPSQRQQRVNALLQEELAGVLQRELDDEALRLATITEVEVSPDLKHARVYVSAVGEETAVRQALRALRKHRVRLQGRIGQDLTLRNTPRLSFMADYTAARAQRIETLLARIEAEHPPAEAPSPDTGSPPPGPEEQE